MELGYAGRYRDSHVAKEPPGRRSVIKTEIRLDGINTAVIDPENIEWITGEWEWLAEINGNTCALILYKAVSVNKGGTALYYFLPLVWFSEMKLIFIRVKQEKPPPRATFACMVSPVKYDHVEFKPKTRLLMEERKIIRTRIERSGTNFTMIRSTRKNMEVGQWKPVSLCRWYFTTALSVLLFLLVYYTGDARWSIGWFSMFLFWGIMLRVCSARKLLR